MRFRFLALLMRGFLFAFSDLGDLGGGGGAPVDPPPPAGAPPAPPEPPAPGGEPGGEPPPIEDPDATFEGFGQTYEELLAQEGDTINGVPRTVLERHAREAKSYRERYQPIARAMRTLHPDDQIGFVQFLDGMTSEDPQMRAAAADWMRQVLDHVSPAQAAAMQQVAQQVVDGQTPPAGPAEDFDPFDPAAIDKRIEAKAREMFEAQQRERQEQQAIADARRELEARAAELAAEHNIDGFGDPRSPEFALLLFQANSLADSIEDPMERLDKAAEAIRERFATQAQKLLKQKATDAGPSPAPPDGGTPGGAMEPQSLDAAAVAAAQRIDKIMRGEAGT